MSDYGLVITYFNGDKEYMPIKYLRKNKNKLRTEALALLIDNPSVWDIKMHDAHLPRSISLLYQIRKPIHGGKRYKVIVPMK